MLSVKASIRLGNLVNEEEAEGINSEACQLSCTRGVGEGGVRKPHLFKTKGFCGFGPLGFSGKQNRAVVRFNFRKMVNFR